MEIEDNQDYNDAQFIDLVKYDVKDVELRMENDYFKSVLSDKISELAQFMGEIPENYYFKVKLVEYDKDTKSWTVSTTVQKALYN